MSRVPDEMRSVRARAAIVSIACAVVVLAMTTQSARAHDADEAALGSLIDAELAFARMGLARGVREAFLANFADDGIVFEPAPGMELERRGVVNDLVEAHASGDSSLVERLTAKLGELGHDAALARLVERLRATGKGESYVLG